MAKYRLKPSVVDAFQWDGVAFPLPMPDWLVSALELDPGEPNSLKRMDDELRLFVWDGTLVVRPHDWVIKGDDGELSRVGPKAFSLLYERAW